MSGWESVTSSATENVVDCEKDTIGVQAIANGEWEARWEEREEGKEEKAFVSKRSVYSISYASFQIR